VLPHQGFPPFNLWVVFYTGGSLLASGGCFHRNMYLMISLATMLKGSRTMNTIADKIKTLCISLGADASGDGEYDLLIDALDIALHMASSNPKLGIAFHQLLSNVIKKEGLSLSDFPDLASLARPSKIELCAYRSGSYMNYVEANHNGGVYDIATGTALSLTDKLHASLAVLNVVANDDPVFVLIKDGIPTELLDASFGASHEKLLAMIEAV
jgi:hypothetical protein